MQTNSHAAFTSSPFPCTTLLDAFESAVPARCMGDALATRVFVGLFDLHEWQPWAADAHALINASERQRVERHRTVAARDRLALCYALHRLLLGEALGCEATDVTIWRDSAGCPRLSGLSTSLSHAEDCVALAITARGPVGIDVEPTLRAAVMPEIAAQVCHPQDGADIACLAGAARNQAVLALWVRKEAFLKAGGVGLQREMQTFPAPDHAMLALPDGETSQVRMLDAGPHWAAAIASRPDMVIETTWLRPAAGYS